MPTERHPSYGQISASRVSSNPAVPVYGSKIRHGHYISLNISASEVDRNLSQEWYHSREEIIRIRMSEHQFAQFITSLNIGGGTPCTIERLQGKGIEAPPMPNEVKQIHKELAEIATDVAKALANAQKRLNAMLQPGGKASKAELTALRGELEKATREIQANIPFVAEQFAETVENTVSEAKGAIEAYMAHAAAKAGISQTQVAGAVQLTIEGAQE